MRIKKYNVYIPSRRHMTSSNFRGITEDILEKSLVAPLNKKAGRNNQGKVTARHRGGGSGRKYRIIDSKGSSKDDISVTIIGAEYDPDRTVSITLIYYADGERAYILAPQGLANGMKTMSDDTAEAKLGNCMPLYHIPVGTQVHSIGLHPDRGGQSVRSAGSSAQLMAKGGKYATLHLPSGEMRAIPIICRAAIDVVGNDGHSLINIGKASRKRNVGIKPTVRGSVMNPNDHPHGGGEGKRGIGRPGPCISWGKPALSLKTRKKNEQSNELIVRGRDGGAIE